MAYAGFVCFFSDSILGCLSPANPSYACSASVPNFHLDTLLNFDKFCVSVCTLCIVFKYIYIYILLCIIYIYCIIYILRLFNIYIYIHASIYIYIYTRGRERERKTTYILYLHTYIYIYVYNFKLYIQYTFPEFHFSCSFCSAAQTFVDSAASNSLAGLLERPGPVQHSTTLLGHHIDWPLSRAETWRSTATAVVLIFWKVNSPGLNGFVDGFLRENLERLGDNTWEPPHIWSKDLVLFVSLTWNQLWVFGKVGCVRSKWTRWQSINVSKN